MGRFDYVRYDDESTEMQGQIKEQFEKLEFLITGKLDQGRPLSMVLTKLEEAYMWVGKAIRDRQINRNGSAPLQEHRTDS